MNKQQISSNNKYKNKKSWIIPLDIKQSFNILFYYEAKLSSYRNKIILSNDVYLLTTYGKLSWFVWDNVVPLKKQCNTLQS